MRERRIVRGNVRRAGRLTPAKNAGLRARAVRLGSGGVMEWHTTGEREELLLGIAGRLRVELARARRTRRIALAAGDSLFLPRRTRHRIVNASCRIGAYIYVTGRC